MNLAALIQARLTLGETHEDDIPDLDDNNRLHLDNLEKKLRDIPKDQLKTKKKETKAYIRKQVERYKLLANDFHSKLDEVEDFALKR